MRKTLLTLLALSFFLFLGASFDMTKDINIAPFAEIINLGPEAAAVKTAPEPPVKANGDIAPEGPLSNPQEVIKAVYATGWSAGSPKKMKYFLDLIKSTELNAIVIDIKDFSGYVLYDTDLDLPKKYGAVEVRIPKINLLLKTLHEEGIYAIARLSVFQDPRLALARPDLAYTSSSTGETWRDRKGLSWIDPAASEAWDYNIAIAKEAFSRGFDEINFDYIRFASDGNLDDAQYPFWDGKTLKQKIIKQFFAYVRGAMPASRISADLFGLTTADYNDLGIGQYYENAAANFDYVAPMVYPSHYYPGAFNIQNPDAHPYEVIKYSLETAAHRTIALSNDASPHATDTPQTLGPRPVGKIRPWLQDFTLGVPYTAEMVKEEIRAVYDATAKNPELMAGWMLWNPANVYTREALQSDTNVRD